MWIPWMLPYLLCRFWSGWTVSMQQGMSQGSRYISLQNTMVSAWSTFALRGPVCCTRQETLRQCRSTTMTEHSALSTPAIYNIGVSYICDPHALSSRVICKRSFKCADVRYEFRIKNCSCVPFYPLRLEAQIPIMEGNWAKTRHKQPGSWPAWDTHKGQLAFGGLGLALGMGLPRGCLSPPDH